jgi:inorganic triphosphatase YgiF
MTSPALIRCQEEIELKLALPTSDPSSVEKRLARTPVLARRKATHLHLHNIYYDTPEQTLRQERVALRLRSVDGDTKPQWLQTLKMGGRSDSALTHRGEWETPVAKAALALKALEATPWAGLDPVGAVFAALVPCFETNFKRTSWAVRRRDGSVVEVSLDIGQITVGDVSTPICELELELLAGQPAALFDIAQQIACTVAVIPLNMSKAERGYALEQGSTQVPLRASPPSLTSDMALLDAAQRVLREMFGQFTANLNTLCASDDPEVVHQARIGWRRFKSAYRLFKPVLAVETVPAWQPLQPLLTFMGELRDLDVALTETLPPLTDAYTAGDVRREENWLTMAQVLTHAVTLQRKAVRYALKDPAVGAALLAITQWLEEFAALNGSDDAKADLKTSLRRWARRRVVHLHKQLKVTLRDVDSPENQHRVRILSKRMRYGIEALRPLLPRRCTQRWYQQALSLQTSVGVTRDVMQAGTLVGKLEIDHGLVEFLRGVAVGKARP